MSDSNYRTMLLNTPIESLGDVFDRNTINSIDIMGITPLKAAIQLKNESMVEKILSLGANPNYRGNGQWYPLHEATYFELYTIVKLLISYGADIRRLTSEGETVISFAHGRILSLLNQYIAINKL